MLERIVLPAKMSCCADAAKGGMVGGRVKRG